SGRVYAATGLTSQGQGHYTSFAQIVANELGCDVTDVTVVTGDTSRFNWGAGTYASRALVTAGNAVGLAAHAVREKVIRLGAELLFVRYVVVHDCGVIINPTIVEGQIHGGVAQGIGGAFYERLHFDDSGQLINASFMDFLMPTAMEVPEIEIAHIETPSPLNPL